jgi:hypothetical protein
MSANDQQIGSRVAAAAPPSIAKGRREVLVAGHKAPATSTARRGRHLRTLIGARKYVWSMTLIGGAVFLLGATTGNFFYAFVPPLIVAAVIVGLVWREATRLSARDFFLGFALDHGFNFSEQMSLMEATPLLGAGDKRRCENYMEGPLEGMPDVAVGLAHYIFETRDERTDRRKRAISVYTPHNYTIAVVELPRAMTTFPGIFLTRRGGWFGRDDWHDRPSLLPVELESSSIASRYELLVRSNQDRGRLLELFKPTFQVWLTELPLQIFFEYSGGTLVVYMPKRVKDGESLQTMLEATRWIAKRITEEGEPLRAAAKVLEVTSTPPPSGTDAFPPPPPATKPVVEPALRAAPEPVAAEPISYSDTASSVPPPSAN